MQKSKIGGAEEKGSKARKMRADGVFIVAFDVALLS